MGKNLENDTTSHYPKSRSAIGTYSLAGCRVKLGRKMVSYCNNVYRSHWKMKSSNIPSTQFEKHFLFMYSKAAT